MGRLCVSRSLEAQATHLDGAVSVFHAAGASSPRDHGSQAARTFLALDDAARHRREIPSSNSLFEFAEAVRIPFPVESSAIKHRKRNRLTFAAMRLAQNGTSKQRIKEPLALHQEISMEVEVARIDSKPLKKTSLVFDMLGPYLSY